MQFTELPCIIVDGLSDAQKRALVIADNQLTLNADWDHDLLSLEIEHLKSVDFDIDLLGFDDNFINDLLSGLDFSDKNKEIDIDEFSDLIELTFKLNTDQYTAVKQKLRAINESPVIALLELLQL